jgi:hypothetical protein
LALLARKEIMLKTVSSITNAIGALNHKGTWNASTNTHGDQFNIRGYLK